MKALISAILILLFVSAAFDQCQTSSFFGLQPIYSCPDPSFLSGNPGGGTFHGSGIENQIFSPLNAGVGTHVISYTMPQSAPIAGYTVTSGLTNAPSNVPLNLLFIGDEELSAPLQIGFTFNFFGVDYTQFRISSNGFITFDLDSWNTGCCSGDNLPSVWGPSNIIAFAWNDLDPGIGGSVGYATIGTAPERVLIVDFTDVPHFMSFTGNVTVQVKLYESNGHIEIHSTQNITDGSPQTIGVQNATGTCGVTAAGTNANPNMSIVNEMLLFVPDSGTYYGHQTGLPIAPYDGQLSSISLGANDVSTAIPLGFAFDFYGANYSEVYVSSNGFMTFDNNGNAGCCSGSNLPNADLPNNLIAFAWNDLNPALGGSIGYTTLGIAPNRVFILDFNEIQHNGGGNPVSVQVKLFETTHLIEIHSTLNASNGSAMTMGLENANGTEALTPAGRNANTLFNVVNERTIFFPYYTSIQVTEVTSLEDVEPPVPFEPELETIYSQCGVDFLFEPYAFDNCSGFVIGTTDAEFPILESTTITWTFTDDTGNSSTITQEVIVEDTTPPIASGFVITIIAEGFFTDEVVWSFSDVDGNVVASGGPYFDGGIGHVLEVANVEGLNGPYSFTGTTEGIWNDNVFSFSIQCQGLTVASGTVNEAQTVTINNISSCNSFQDIIIYCDLESLESVSAIDNCAGAVLGTNNAVFPITSNTTITWTFDDGNGNITTQNQNIVFQNLNTGIGWVGASLVSNETGQGITYTWVDCANNFAPVGSSNQAFTPSQNGTYGVLLQVSSCSIMSECIEVSNVGLTEHGSQRLVVYPNPSKDFVILNSSIAGDMELTDLSGKTVWRSHVLNGDNHFDLHHLSNGVYTIRVVGQNLAQTSMLVIQK